MGLTVEPERFERCLEAVYSATVSPSGWRAALGEIAALFDAGFADVCTWTTDRKHVSGLAHGLDVEDYDDVFLGYWFNRNVWSKQKPVRVAGEVMSTRQMVAREDLRLSEIYRDYLHERGLHEGLRLSLWVDETGLADISVLRPWSAGAFGPAEIELGRALLPHVQRAAALTRRLREAEFRIDAGDASKVAAIAFDRDGVPFWLNGAAEVLTARGVPLRLAGRTLAALTDDATAELRAAIALAVGKTGTLRQASTVLLPLSGDANRVTLVIQPLSSRSDWTMPRTPAALALLHDPQAGRVPIETVRQLYRLTTAEAQLAVDLLSGLSLNEVAARTGRSRNTTRTHLARLMEKTGTARQVDLFRLLADIGTLSGAFPQARAAGNPFAALPAQSLQ